MDARLRESFLQELMILQSSQDSLEEDKNLVNITLLSDSGSVGRTLSAKFIACDTSLTHVLLRDLRTPTGIQSSALLRLNDVISITYS